MIPATWFNLAVIALLLMAASVPYAVIIILEILDASERRKWKQ